jgi:hypothetical protein
MQDECRLEQLDEIEALQSVYFDNFKAIDVESQPFAFQIMIDVDAPGATIVHFICVLRLTAVYVVPT